MGDKRARYLRLFCWLLMPYLALAVGASFLHTHCYAEPDTGDCGVLCPACAWLHSGVAEPEIYVAASPSLTILHAIVTAYEPHSAGAVRLTSSRGPPLG